jgi:hypothetical protein
LVVVLWSLLLHFYVTERKLCWGLVLMPVIRLNFTNAIAPYAIFGILEIN